MMPRIIDIEHRTTYRYSAPVEQSWQLARLQPRVLPHQRLLAHTLTIDPRPDWRDARVDAFGNPACAFSLHGAHDTLEVLAVSRVEVSPRRADTAAVVRPWDAESDMSGQAQVSCVQAPRSGAQSDRPLESARVELAHFLGTSPQVPVSPQARRYASQSFRPGAPFATALQDLAARIHRDFTFDATATTVTTPIQTVLATRRGVCQDFAHLMIAGLRALGIPARYVSGYIVTEPPPGQPRMVGADASHAWVSAWCPGEGWIDIDPTNNRRADTDFVTLGWGRDFSDVSPLRGVILGGGDQELMAQVTVTPHS